MTLDQIKESLNKGLSVYWGNSSYQVMMYSFGECFIKCKFNDHLISLNDSEFEEFKQSDFYIGE
jgi:hypothetical protein